MDRIADDELDPSSVITHTLPLDQAPTALEMFEHRRGERIKVVLEP